MKPVDLETIYSREVVAISLKQMGKEASDIEVEALFRLTHYLIQVGRADALWQLSEDWAAAGRMNAAPAVYRLHTLARDNASERRGQLKLLLQAAFGDKAEKVVPDGSLN